MRKTALIALLLAMSGAAQAHEVWIERDGDGPARIYLGEPAEALPEGGDPQFPKLQSPRVTPAATAEPVRRAGFIEVAVPAGDVRATDDNIFAPWGDEGAREGVIYYARAGRAEPRATLPLEIAPVAANGDRFLLVRDGAPVPAAEITLIAPGRRSSKLTTDAAGQFTVPTGPSGRYLLTAAREEAGRGALTGGAVDTVHHITTTSFLVP